MKAADYGRKTHAVSAFVSTNSICQGQQVPILWPLIFETGHEIAFVHTSFKWANLASHNAGVTVVIVGISNHAGNVRRLFSVAENGEDIVKEVSNINAYLVAGQNVLVQKAMHPCEPLAEMNFGNKPVDGGHLFLSAKEKSEFPEECQQFIRPFLGSDELINGLQRFCLWLTENDASEAVKYAPMQTRLAAVKEMRNASPKTATRTLAEKPYQFGEPRHIQSISKLVVPRVSSEDRAYLPVNLVHGRVIIGDSAFALYDAPLWNMALIASRLHLVWIATVCGKLETRYRYSNTLGWNTFPVPTLTEKNQADLTRCAEDILLAREAHFPATIAELYDPATMPANLREAHEHNDEVLERIYIGRRFRNDTERLEKLFELYGKMTAAQERSHKNKKETTA